MDTVCVWLFRVLLLQGNPLKTGGSEMDLTTPDVGLPDGDGVSLCRQPHGEGVQSPVLFLAAKDDAEKMYACVKVKEKRKVMLHKSCVAII